MPAPSGPPTGVVTFLFSDVQGSTRLWEQHPQPMQRALARHDDLLRAAIAQSGGHVFKTGGDAFYAAFAQPEDALAAALAAQIALHAEPWGLPEGHSLRVRLALHAGAAELRQGDYFGSAPGRAARLLGAAHGGQTLVSEATALVVGVGGLPPGASLRSLGRHRLKDLTQPQEIFQLAHPNLPQDFPPPRSLESFQHNLPGQLTSFVGREAEMAQAHESLTSSRLVTLTGTGGAGKSRLAVQVAADALDDFSDGAWLVELAPLSDPALVPQAVAGVLGLGEEAGRGLGQTLADALRPKSLLLVLDNCEHLVDACARLAETLLRACPKLKILATSREALDIPGECALPLSSLGLPPGPPLPPAEDLLAQSASVRLFVERATSALPAFRFSNGNAGAVTQVCARLDGIPLALELAAARVKVLSPEQIAGRLDDRFRLLTGGSRTALPRQQTLRALIDWSYDLLPPAERAVFRRLSVFAGGWSLDAAEAVCAGGDSEDSVEDWEVLDLLSHLVAKSLVVVEPPEDGQVRYRLLENLRRYGAERLAEAGEAPALQGRHLAWFLRFAEEAEAHLTGPELARQLNRLERDHDNLRLALATGRKNPEGAEAFLRLAGALSRFWSARSFLSEGRGWLEAALDAAPGAPPEIRSKALNGVGVLAWSCGDVAAARTFHERDLALRRAMADRPGAARALANLGILAAGQGDYDEARRLFEECLTVYREMGRRDNVALMLNNLGTMLLDLKDIEAALPYLEESLGMSRSLGNSRGVAAALNNLGVARMRQTKYPEARRFFCESLLVQQVLGDKQLTSSTLNNIARTVAWQGDAETAAVLLAAAESILRAAGVPGLTAERQEQEETLARVRAALAAPDLERAWQRGARLGATEAINFVLEKYGPLTE